MTFASQAHATIATLLETDMDPRLKHALEIVAMNVTIVESGRMTRTAGEAKVKLNQFGIIVDTLQLTLGTKLMSRATSEQVKETILHELAHLIDFVMRGKSNHDWHWFAIIRALGGKGDTYHQINTAGLERVVTRYIYVNMEGKEFIFRKGSHYKAMRMPHIYRFVGIRKYKGKTIVKDIPAQYADCAA